MGMVMKVYVASSWRNELQPKVVWALRDAGFEVYDFRNPPNGSAFSWSRVWEEWSPDWEDQFDQALDHPLAKAGYYSDIDALQECDICVLVLPCGRSAHLEAGYAAGMEKRLVILVPEPIEPELMYKMGELVFSPESAVAECLAYLGEKENELNDPFPDGGG